MNNIKTTQTWKIEDCIELMQEYPDNHFDLILTDPPYGDKVEAKIPMIEMILEDFIMEN